MEYISLIGILVALTIIVIGSMRGLNLIILSSVATFIVLATGGVAVIDNYTTTYMNSVGASVASLFPLFLGGQLFGKLLDKSGLTGGTAEELRDWLAGKCQKPVETVGPDWKLAEAPAPVQAVKEENSEKQEENPQ